eukprot:5778147-Pleurochrysis_carterae.AAC.1
MHRWRSKAGMPAFAECIGTILLRGDEPTGLQLLIDECMDRISMLGRNNLERWACSTGSPYGDVVALRAAARLGRRMGRSVRELGCRDARNLSLGKCN